MTEHTDTNEQIPRVSVDGDGDDGGSGTARDTNTPDPPSRRIEADTVERIAAWLDGFNHQQWRPAYATITQEASRQFADAIRRGDWRAADD